ncbi:MAG: methyltransferase, partial [Bacteroidales bacterium]
MEDGRTAMKVGTDGVLLGAWGGIPSNGRLLDVGCGSGLIALMSAQRSSENVIVDAVEIDKGAVNDAKDNFDVSPWRNRLNIYCDDFRTFATSSSIKYEAILSNPPYFCNSLLPEKSGRIIARHTASLGYDELFCCVARLLSPTGKFSMITPADCYNDVSRIALDNSLYLTRSTYVISRAGCRPKRILSEWGGVASDCIMGKLEIEKSPGIYSDEYI